MKVTQENFKTLKDQLVVLVPELKKETESGIVIPETVLAERMKERGVNEFFKVIAVGEDVKTIKVGDFVLCSRVLPVPVQATDSDFKVAIAREYDVVGFVTK